MYLSDTLVSEFSDVTYICDLCVPKYYFILEYFIGPILAKIYIFCMSFTNDYHFQPLSMSVFAHRYH